MENTALNGNTNATKDHEDWKKKKGYGPILVTVSLALLLVFSVYSTGGPVEGGTKEIQSVAASSSSTSLVGSGTAASDLKTLTIELDDDANIDVLLSEWLRKEKPTGGSSAHCKENTGYNCGAVFPPDGDTCGQKGCCCHLENGAGFKLNTCDNAKGYAYRGCYSCWGQEACFNTNNINAGTSSCRGQSSCKDVSDSTIAHDSCHGQGSCKDVSDSTIAHDSCHGLFACKFVQNSTIHDGSCQGGDTSTAPSCKHVKNSIIGKGSCNDGSDRSLHGGQCYGTDCDSSCAGLENKKIGNNSCNGGNIFSGGVCHQCKHNVPDNACNPGITDDMDIRGYCNYCL